MALKLILQADSITAVQGLYGTQLITLFKPTADSVEQIKKLKLGDVIGHVELKDPYDSGEMDTHVYHRSVYFLKLVETSCKAITVSFMVMDI